MLARVGWTVSPEALGAGGRAMAQFKPKFSSGQHAGVLVTEAEIVHREKLGFTRWCVNNLGVLVSSPLLLVPSFIDFISQCHLNSESYLLCHRL